MTKAKPSLPTLFSEEDLQQPGKTATAIRAAGASANSGQKTVMVDFNKLHIIPGFNPRSKDTQAAREHIESIGQSILNNGFYQDKPLAVFVRKIDGKDTICVRDGHNRYAAVQWANRQKRNAVKQVPVIFDEEEMSLRDMNIRFHTANNGRPLTPYELAVVVMRLGQDGMKVKDIADHLGITERYIRDLGMLYQAPPELIEMIENGQVSSTLAIETLRSNIQAKGQEKGGAQALRTLEKALVKATAKGSKRVSAKHIADGQKPKKFKKEPTSTATAPDRTHQQPSAPVDGIEHIRFDAALLALEVLEKHRNNSNIVSAEEADAIDDGMKQIVKKFGQEPLATYAVEAERYQKTGLVRLGFVVLEGDEPADDEPTPPKKGGAQKEPKAPAKKQPAKKQPAKKEPASKTAAKKGATKPASKTPAKKAAPPKKTASKKPASKPEPVQQDLLDGVAVEEPQVEEGAAAPLGEPVEMAPVDLVAAEQARIAQEAATL